MMVFTRPQLTRPTKVRLFKKHLAADSIAQPPPKLSWILRVEPVATRQSPQLTSTVRILLRNSFLPFYWSFPTSLAFHQPYNPVICVFSGAVNVFAHMWTPVKRLSFGANKFLYGVSIYETLFPCRRIILCNYDLFVWSLIHLALPHCAVSVKLFFCPSGLSSLKAATRTGFFLRNNNLFSDLMRWPIDIFIWPANYLKLFQIINFVNQYILKNNFYATHFSNFIR